MNSKSILHITSSFAVVVYTVMFSRITHISRLKTLISSKQPHFFRRRSGGEAIKNMFPGLSRSSQRQLYRLLLLSDKFSDVFCWYDFSQIDFWFSSHCARIITINTRRRERDVNKRSKNRNRSKQGTSLSDSRGSAAVESRFLMAAELTLLA